MLNQLLRRFRRWLSQIWGKLNNWINPPLPKGYKSPRLPDHEYEWLFKQLLKGVGEGWTQDQVIRWLRHNERRVTESQWLEWLPRFEDVAKQDEEIQKQLLGLSNLGCGRISEAAARLAGAKEGEKGEEEKEERKPPTNTSSAAEEWFKDGNQRYSNGDFHGAIASWDRALEIKPDYHQAWLVRGLLLDDLGEYQQAIASYDKALEIKPDDHDAWHNRGIALANLGEYQQAIESYDKALEIKPDKHEAWYNRGWALDNLGEYQQAVASYDKALEIKPDYHKAWHNRGVALDNLGEYQQAIESFDQALEIKPDFHQAWYDRGFALLQLGEYQQAIESYDRALEIKPDYHEAWHERGWALHNLGEYQQAIASFDHALEIKPDKYEAWSNRGIALANLGEHQQAIASYDRALEIKRDDHVAWNNRGVALDNLGEHQQAIESYDQALEIKPDDHPAWANRGWALVNLGKYQQAIASYDQALEIKPDDHLAWDNRGLALDKLGEYQQAIASWDQALEIKPDDHEAWYNRGLALYELGEYQQAIASYDRALEIKPDFHLAWNNRGVALADLGEYEQAIESYDQSLEFKPDDHQAWNNRGVALEQAIESYDQALKIKPDFHQAWVNRGITAGKLIHSAPFMVPDAGAVRLSELLQNPALDLRDYPGKIASYQEGLKQCPKATHPQGWGILHHQMGQARYLRGRLATDSAGTTTDELGQRQTARYFYGQAVNSYREALTVITAESSDLSLPPTNLSFPRMRESTENIESSDLSLSRMRESTENIELHLEIVEDLIKALLELGENSEAKQWHEHGFGILQALVNQAYQSDIPVGAVPPCLPPSVKRLKLKFAGYYRFAFDFAAQDNHWSNALAAAELEKNIYLTWLLSATTDPVDISPTVAQMQTLVNETTALVYWYYSSHSLITFILTADKLTAIPFPASSLAAVDSFVSDWNRDYHIIYSEKKSTPPTSASQTSQGGANRGQSENSQIWNQKLSAYLPRLHTLLNIPEITAAIPAKISQLILIPHRDLHRLPLEALFPDNLAMTRLPSAAFGLRNSPSIPQPLSPTEGRKGSNSPSPTLGEGRGEGRNVSGKKPILYPTEGRKGSKLEGLNLLTIAGLDSATDLTFTDLEAAAIGQFFPNSTLLINKEASETAVKSALAAGYQVFHFSGHGYYDQKHPNKSTILLSGEDCLTGAEIAGLSLNSYLLAYIDACETGITNLETIDTEYVGLVSAFLRAGVGQVISSLWPVNDESSALLAMKFYQEYLAGEPATVALAKAKTWLRKATWGEIAGIYQQCWDNASNDFQRSVTKKALSSNRGNNPSEIPFQDTYYWSGVVISG